MRTKLKSFILTALLFTGVSHINARAQTSADTVIKQSQNKTDIRQQGYLSALEGEWHMLPSPGNDTVAGHVPEIRFDTREGHLSGSTGCNRMSGGFLVTEKTLRISDKMITTRMYCEGYNETVFLQKLAGVDSYKFKKGFLILISHGKEVSRWSR